MNKIILSGLFSIYQAIIFVPKYLLQIILLTSFITCSSPTQEKKDRKQDDTFSISPSFTIDTVKDVFNIPEIHVKQSPDAPQLFQLALNENVTGFDVSPEGGIAAVIINEPGKEDNIRIWDFLQNKIKDILPNPEKYSFIDIAWHPDAGSLFAIAKKDNQYYILHFTPTSDTWKNNSIYSSKDELKRLVIGPRPFVPSENWGNIYYRLFFGIKNVEGNSRIATINEKGEHFFQVVGPEKSITYFKYEDWDTELLLSNMTAEWALPIAFHPAGHQLIWEDKKNNFFTADYNSRIWDTCHPLNFKVPPKGLVYPAPNGIGLLHWQENKNGIALYPINSSLPINQISQFPFGSPPKFTPDGKGVIGITHNGDKIVLNYVPINLPLCDVVNAWMFVDTEEELGLFEKHFGLFRPTAHEQLYQFYETERYGQCGDYDFTTPIRPYLVTTDVFWEIFGAAFQGIFIVNEREQAIPAFREFVSSADKFYKQNHDTNFWMPVFNTLSDLLNT